MNDEGASLGRLVFESELRLAESAPLVLLVIAPGPELSPRMTYMADTALQTHYEDRVLLVSVGDSDLPPPSLLRGLQPYRRAEELLALVGRRQYENSVCCVFDFLLKGARQPM